jgi:hypothetical protein
MRATGPTASLTLAAFLDWEGCQPERFELVGGIVRMMAGARRITTGSAATSLQLSGPACAGRHAPPTGRS